MQLRVNKLLMLGSREIQSKISTPVKKQTTSSKKTRESLFHRSRKININAPWPWFIHILITQCRRSKINNRNGIHSAFTPLAPPPAPAPHARRAACRPARRGRPNDERAPRRTPLHQIVSRLLFGHEKSVFSVLFIIAFKMFDTCHVS